ncbi:MAG: hypothetical protein LUG16_04995 [Candidatus Gastranaerophilales bacterium]|nr:hypothetical protein [Candidatus Gastranaerophilales bacterium]
MKAGNVNNQVTFGRAIKIGTNKGTGSTPALETSANNLCHVLNSQKPLLYPKKKTAEIKDFFQQTLGDYNGEKGVIVRKNENDTLILLSGKDADEIKLLETKQKKEKKSILMNRNLKFTEKNELLSDIENYKNYKLNSKVENGKNGKPDSLITLDFKLDRTKSPASVQLGSVSYMSLKKDSGFLKDGHAYDESEIVSKGKDGCVKVDNVNFDSRKLDIIS